MPCFLWLGATGISATRKPKVSPAMFTGRSLLLQKLRRMVWMSGWGVVVLIARTSEVQSSPPLGRRLRSRFVSSRRHLHARTWLGPPSSAQGGETDETGESGNQDESHGVGAD